MLGTDPQKLGRTKRETDSVACTSGLADHIPLVVSYTWAVALVVLFVTAYLSECKLAR